MGVSYLKENFLRKVNFPITVCGVEFASGVITGICLNPGVQGYALPSDLYESTSLEGSFPPASFKYFTLCDLGQIFIV